MHWWVGTFLGTGLGKLCLAGRNRGEEGEVKSFCMQEVPISLAGNPGLES